MMPSLYSTGTCFAMCQFYQDIIQKKTRTAERKLTGMFHDVLVSFAERWVIVMKQFLSYHIFIVKKHRFTYVIWLFLLSFTLLVHSLNYLQSKQIIYVKELTFGAERYIQTSWERILLNFFYSDKMALFIGVFTAMFTLIEYNNSYLKNIWIHRLSASKWLVSKYIILLLYIIISFVMVSLITLAFYVFYMKESNFGSLLKVISMTSFQIYLVFSFCLVIVFYSYLVKKLLYAVLGTILYIMFAPVTIYKFIDLILQAIFSNDNFSIVKYLPYGNIFQLTFNSSPADFITAFLSATAFILFAGFANWILLTKRDIL